MLVLSRQANEEIIVGDPKNPIGKIIVVDIRGDKVRLGLDFPRDTPIHRREVADAINKERSG